MHKTPVASALRGFLFLVGLVLTSCGGGVTKYPVAEFVLPNGFLGVVILELDSRSGITPSSDGRVVTFRIPESGILSVASFYPITQGHKETARYEDGTQIMTGFEEDPARQSLSQKQLDDEIRLRGGIGTSDQIIYLIGTDAQLQQFRSHWKPWHTIETKK